MNPTRTTTGNTDDDSSAGAESAARPGRPENRAFVVQVASDCDATDGELRGRVQHLATSDGGNFASFDGLLGIIRRILVRDRRESGRND